MTDTDQQAPSEGRLALRYSAMSDVGRVRKDNQDSGFASEHLLVIADGVGGAARGDLASSTAVQALRRLDGPPPADLLEALAGAVHRAHDRIAELVEQDPELDGTSTTVTSALFDGHRIGVAHVGDSRGYLLRDGTLSQLTRDHTFVQGLVDEGRITEQQSRSHPQRNLILRAVDGVRETDPDLFYVEVAPGDRLLLCSDGASGVLEHERLADILGTGTVDYAAVELVRASLEAGSSDNITCVVADVIDPSVAVEDDGVPQGATTGPMLVGAAAEQSRRTGAGVTGRAGAVAAGASTFQGHRGGDTGEIEPVPDEPHRSEAAGPADPEELRYAPRPPRGRRRASLLGGLLVLGLLAAAAFAGYRWTQAQYYVAEHDGRVAIYRGVQADVPGLTLSRVAEDTELTVAALPDYAGEKVAAGITADSLADARTTVARLTENARPCPEGSAAASPSAGGSASPSPTASPTGSPAATPAGSATRGAAASPSPTASPTATPTGSGPASPSASGTLAPPECVEVSR